MQSSYGTVHRLSSALTIHYFLFCSSFALLYDETRHQQRFEHIPGFVQDFEMQIQGVFKDSSRTKTTIFKELQTDIHSACVNNRKPKIPKGDIFWHIKSSLVRFSLNFLLDISLNYFLFCLLL